MIGNDLRYLRMLRRHIERYQDLIQKMKKVILILCCILFQLTSQIEAGVTDSIFNVRPRILAGEESFQRIKKESHIDTLLNRYIRDVLLQADKMLAKPLPEYRLDEAGALLNVSRDCLDRILTLGVAFHLTDNEKYADGVKAILKTVCNFKDWHYYHFLDVAEMATAVAIGYDWLYNRWSPDFREEVKETLIRNAIIPGLAVYGSSPWQYWLDVEYNWNQVCNGGLAMAAIAIADTDPVYADIIIPKALEYLPAAMATYAPDGAWGEGVSYWFYATRYTGYLLGTLRAAFGHDFGISHAPGFDITGYFPIHMTTPSEGYFSYADIDMNKRAIPLPVMFWLSERFDNPHFAAYEHQILKNHPASALDVLYYRPPSCPMADIDLDAHFDGIGKYVVMRENWLTEDNGMFVAISGGDNRMNHGHLDKGSFEFECDGIKWVRDLGSDKYHLPGYWEKEEGGERWNYFRLNTEGHSTLIINGKSQIVDADTYFIETDFGKESSIAVLDLTEAYKGSADIVKRRINLDRAQRMLLVEDEIVSAENTENIQWQVITEAEITGGGNSLTLTHDNKNVEIKILSSGHNFIIESAEREEPEAKNAGYKKISIYVEKPQKKETIRVAFLPHNRRL